MTLISDGSRGIGETRANWFDELNNSPPASVSGILSSKSTPMRRDPSKKMTIADYKNLKTTGAKPSPRPAASTSTPENKQEPAHAKDNSIAAVKNKETKPVGVEKHNGVGAAKVEHKTERLVMILFSRYFAWRRANPQTTELLRLALLLKRRDQPPRQWPPGASGSATPTLQ